MTLPSERELSQERQPPSEQRMGWGRLTGPVRADAASAAGAPRAAGDESAAGAAGAAGAAEAVGAAGDVIFARYAFPPNELGYCGPGDAGALLSHASTGGGGPEVARRAKEFDGAWPYLQVIASAAGLEDPLDPRVVEAYWVGNDLLEQVEPAQLLTVLGQRFVGQVGGYWDRVTPDDGALAHHSFQVFAVYPWVGLLRSGSPVPLSVLDQCRIRWGTVLSVAGEHAIVSSRPLVWESGALRLAGWREERVRWSAEGNALSAGLSVGDVVSLHWDWVCDRLSPSQADALRDFSESQVALANRYV